MLFPIPWRGKIFWFHQRTQSRFDHGASIQPINSTQTVNGGFKYCLKVL